MAAIRLSRKAWNNVLIFAMLIMIFLLNGLHHKLNPEQTPQGPQPVLPKQSFVVVLSLPGVKLERIGTDWRATGEPLALEPAALIERWQSAEAELLVALEDLKELQQGSPLIAASFWLAGEESARVYQIYRFGSAFALFDKKQQRWLSLDLDQARRLFPFDLQE